MRRCLRGRTETRAIFFRLPQLQLFDLLLLDTLWSPFPPRLPFCLKLGIVTRQPNVSDDGMQVCESEDALGWYCGVEEAVEID